MKATDILYTPLDTPDVPNVDIPKLLSWVSKHTFTQEISGRQDASKMSELSESYPTPQVTMQIQADTGSLTVFAGPNWIGGRDSGQLRLRNVSRAKQAQLFSALGIAVPPYQP